MSIHTRSHSSEFSWDMLDLNQTFPLNPIKKENDPPQSSIEEYHQLFNPEEVRHMEKIAQKCMGVVCQVCPLNLQHRGTGYLIGGNLLITNHHVLGSQEEAQKATIIFFQVSHQNSNKTETTVQLKKLLLDPSIYFYTSPNHVTFEKNPQTQEEIRKVHPADKDHLDFTIVGVKTDPYLFRIQDRILSVFDSTAPKQGDLACIIQNPEIIDAETGLKGDLKWSPGRVHRIDPCSIHYDTETMPGSSGGAVIDREGRLIALHHQRLNDCGCNPKRPHCNSGVLIDKISNYLPISEKTKIKNVLENFENSIPFASIIRSQVQEIDQKVQYDPSSPVLQQDLDSLYRTMLRFIGENIQFPPSLIQDIWIPFKNLENISCAIANTNELKFAFIKTYLLYAEVAWYQLWYHAQQPKLKSNKDIILSIKNRLLEELPKEVRFKDGKLVSTVDIKFYLQCIEQAAQCLNLENISIWEEYTESVKNQRSFYEIYQFLFSKAKSIALETWYVSAWKLHWLSANLITLEAFKNKIEPEIKNCLEQGKEYTICLATVFMTLLKSSKSSPELKECVFSGLKKLIYLEHQSEWLDYLYCPEEAWNAFMGKTDRFGETRYLVMEYLLELAHQENGAPFKKESLELLIQRSEEVNSSKNCRLREEQKLYNKKISLNEERKQLKTECAHLKLTGETRSKEDQQRVNEIEEKILDLEDEEENADTTISRIQLLGKKKAEEELILQEIQQHCLSVID